MYWKLTDVDIKQLCDFPWESTSFSGIKLGNSKWVDTDEFDIVPKKSHIEKQLKETEERLRKVKQRKEEQDTYFKEQIKSLELEIDILKQKIK